MGNNKLYEILFFAGKPDSSKEFPILATNVSNHSGQRQVRNNLGYAKAVKIKFTIFANENRITTIAAKSNLQKYILYAS